MGEQTIIKKATFKDVAAEIELDSILLKIKKDQTEDFTIKGKQLATIGFENSLATRMYLDIGNSKEVIEKYHTKYPMYKFLLDTQLERIYNKYDLYERELPLYIGDIPTNNMQHIFNFKIDIDDIEFTLFDKENLIITNDLIADGKPMPDFIDERFYRFNMGQTKQPKDKFFEKITQVISYELIKQLPRNTKEKQLSLQEIMVAVKNVNESIKNLSISEFDNSQKLTEYFKNCYIGSPLLISAVESLFHSSALEISKERIIKYKVLDEDEVNKFFEKRKAEFQLDLDPIVMCKVKGGKIVITSWGDEANDELIINPNLN